jgi:hypothetical protein
VEVEGGPNNRVEKTYEDFDRLEMLILQTTSKQSAFFGEGKDPIPKLSEDLDSSLH